MTRMIPPHGFVWPDGLPDCSLCDRPPNDQVHVTPPRAPMRYGESDMRVISADKNSSPLMPVRSHAYTPNSPSITSQISCVACGGNLANGIHVVGMPAGMAPSSSNSGLSSQSVGSGGPFGNATFASVEKHAFEKVEGLDACVTCGGPAAEQAHAAPTAVRTEAREAGTQLDPETIAGLDAWEAELKQVAFVSEIGQRLVFATPGHEVKPGADLPREVAATWEKASKSNPFNVWVTGRYVEADRPNRNAAFWSTADLEIGQPSVTHGPINWNHSEKEIVGAIAASEMVMVDRQAAAASGVGNHIVALGAIWGFIYPDRARLIQKASDGGKLWYSMECISESVQCLAGDCGRQMAYGEYMQVAPRCQHMRDGAPRRFVNPTFGGGAMIVPPIRPGWANADARVMKQAAALAERQAAAFAGLTTSDAEQLVAQLFQNGEH